MTKTLLCYIERCAALKAKRRTLSVQEEKLLQEIHDVVIAQGALDDEIFLWEKEIAKMRAFDKITTPSMKESDNLWNTFKKFKEAFGG